MESTDEAGLTLFVSGQAGSMPEDLSLAGCCVDCRNAITAYCFQASGTNGSRVSLDVAHLRKKGPVVLGWQSSSD